jgi:UDP-glucose 4-epimerase
MLRALQGQNHEAVCFDNLSTGHRDLVYCDNFIEGDLANKSSLSDIFANNNFDAVIHFAGSSQVGESINQPDTYYRNNITNTQNLLDVMIQSNVKKIVFSSTAAIFGNPQYIPINEDHLCNPINPYGRSKLLIEHMLADYDVAYDLKSVALRYFNAAGADSSGLIGERHIPETHLIPLVLQAASGRKKDITIFGNDYSTNDGTCVRDYIHVSDLCDAHILSLDWLEKGGSSKRYNLGNGNGFSVNDVVKTAEKVTGNSIAVIKSSRRPGDPEILVADSNLIKKELGWKPKYEDLDGIIADAWKWEILDNKKSL